MQELSQLQDKHATRPDVFEDVEEEQEIKTLTQEITQVQRHVYPDAFLYWLFFYPGCGTCTLYGLPPPPTHTHHKLNFLCLQMFTRVQK